MSWLLRIDSGPRKGEATPLHGDSALRVGRTDRSNLALPQDSFLSGVHFEVAPEGESCVLRDLNSSNGTTFRGDRIKAVRLHSGDSFAAGHTHFSVWSETAVEPAAEACEVEALQPESRDRLLHALRSSQQPLYAVLDGARDPRILATLVQAKSPYAWLFEAGTPPELMSFAPYLVPLPAASPVMESLVDLGWTAHWGIYLTSASPPGELLAFLKRLLLVQQPDGQEALLRFYDPRVLLPFIETSTSWQWNFLFGTVQTYLLPGETPQTATMFSQGRGGVERSDLYLEEQGRIVPKAMERSDSPADPRKAQEATPVRRDRLVLSSQQMAKMEGRKRDPYLASLLKEMRGRFPERFAVADRGEEWVQYASVHSKLYEVQEKADVRMYVLLTMQLGRNFDEDASVPWASDLLRGDLPPKEKIARLMELAGEHLAASESVSHKAR